RGTSPQKALHRQLTAGFPCFGKPSLRSLGCCDRSVTTGRRTTGGLSLTSGPGSQSSTAICLVLRRRPEHLNAVWADGSFAIPCTRGQSVVLVVVAVTGSMTCYCLSVSAALARSGCTHIANRLGTLA